MWWSARTRGSGGAGYAITGHHELMIPLLAAALIEKDRMTPMERRANRRLLRRFHRPQPDGPAARLSGATTTCFFFVGLMVGGILASSLLPGCWWPRCMCSRPVGALEPWWRNSCSMSSCSRRWRPSSGSNTTGPSGVAGVEARAHLAGADRHSRVWHGHRGGGAGRGDSSACGR